ncbi:MAG: hypothetical protein K6G08_10050 [Prevotella sp.]|nr:hypothetical protein [Prevotella sp.]
MNIKAIRMFDGGFHPSSGGLSSVVSMMGLAWIMNHSRLDLVANFLYIDISSKREAPLR